MHGQRDDYNFPNLYNLTVIYTQLSSKFLPKTYQVVGIRKEPSSRECDVCIDIKKYYKVRGMVDIPRQIHPNTLAKRNGPGPNLALRYNNTPEPMKTNIPNITEG